MLKKDFWYDLPKELIAQEPADPRDSARLMVLDRKNDTIEHRIFHDLPEYLNAGDVLVVNNSKVLPARLMGVKVPTGAVCEVLLLRQAHGDTWECLARPGRRTMHRKSWCCRKNCCPTCCQSCRSCETSCRSLRR